MIYQIITMLPSLFLSLCVFVCACVRAGACVYVCCLTTNIDLSKKKKSHDLGIASGTFTLSFFFLIPN